MNNRTSTSGGSTHNPPDPRPPAVMSSDHPTCHYCTWVLSPDLLVFRLKYINRVCIQHGRLLG